MLLRPLGHTSKERSYQLGGRPVIGDDGLGTVGARLIQ